MSSFSRTLVAANSLRVARAFSTSAPAFKYPHEAAIKKAGLPVPPSNPKSAYILFTQEHFATHGDELKSRIGKGNVAALASELSELWTNASSEQKDRYTKLAEADRRTSIRAFDEFVGKLRPGDIDAIEAIAGKKIRFPAGRKATLAGKGLRPEPRPLSAYFVYMDKLRKDGDLLGAASGGKEFIKAASQKWKELTDSDKKPFQDAAAELKDAYNARKSS